MKILIAEDSKEKLSHILSAIVGACNVPREDISCVQSAFDAKKELLENKFDIFILDILLPTRVEDEPTQQSSLRVLEELSTNPKMFRPHYVVGLTAFEDTLEAVEPRFREKMWTVLHYDPTSEEWLSAIKNCISYVSSIQNNPTPQTYRSEVCILTALADPEERALLKLDWKWGAPEPVDGDLFARRGEFQAANGESYSVILAHTPRMGMVSTALVATKLIYHYQPRFIVMTGICAGYESKARLGDVLVADPCWDYQSGKRVSSKDKDTSFEADPHQITLPQFLRSKLDHLKNDGPLWAQIKSDWQGTQLDHELSLKVGPVACGSSVLDDEQAMEEIKRQNRKLLGVEMETYGLYAAASLAPKPKPTAFAMKAVCDFGNGTKNDVHQTYAAYTSARALSAFLERYYHVIRDEAGSA